MAERKSNKPSLVPAVGYVRMSTDRQEESPQQQRDEICRLAEGKFEIIRWYTDEGISGAESDKRKGFQSLIHDATERGDFEVILCWDQDRFSRFDPIEANYYWHILRKAGVRIVTVAQGELDLQDLGGWLTASVAQYGKAQFLRDHARNVLRGSLARAKQGKYARGRAPYGYATEDGRIVLGDPDKVEAVRWLFNQYADTDTSMSDMAAELNERGVDPPSGPGKKWAVSTIHYLLHRDAYLGKMAQFRESKGKFYTVRDGQVAPANGRRIKPEDEWFVIDCPPIIDEPLYQRVQAKLKANSRKTYPRKKIDAPLLNGVLYCSHCGEKMYANQGTDKKHGKHIAFTCSTYHREGKHGCNRNLVRESQLLDYLIPLIQKTILAPCNFDRLRVAVRELIGQRQQVSGRDLPALESRLAKLEAELQVAARELKRVPNDLYDLAVADVREIKQKRDTVAVEVAAAKATPGLQPRDIEGMVQRALAGLKDLGKLLKAADQRVARSALQTLIDRIDLTWEHQHYEKMVYSQLQSGVVRFGSYNLVQSG